MNAYSKSHLLLSAENIHLQYGEKVILRDINFKIHNVHRELSLIHI